MPKILLLLCSLFLYISLGGAFLDEWWHADDRVETFFTLPHSILYAGIFMNGMIVLLYVLYQMKRNRSFSPYKIKGNRELALAGTGSLLQLSAGLFDMIYHDLVGFDVTIWSPPHLAAIFGGVISAIGISYLWSNRSGIGFILSMASAILYVQFALSEFLVDGGSELPSRFETIPAYYSIMFSLFSTLVLTLSLLKTSKPIATIILLISFIFQAIIWSLWLPTKNGIEFSFPFFLFPGAIGLDLLIRNNAKEKFLLYGFVISSVIYAISVWIPMKAFFDIGSFSISIIGSILAVLAGYYLGIYFNRSVGNEEV